jgi:hypothetical protein
MTFAEQYLVWKAPQKKADKKEPIRFKQPLPTKRLTGWLVAWTALLLLATAINAGTLYKTDYTPQRTVTATQRAWVSFQVILRGPFRVLPDGTGIAPFEGRFKNYGNSVANAVNLEFQMTTRATRTGAQPGDQIYKSFCEKARSNQSAIGLSLFPADEEKRFFEAAINAAQMQAGTYSYYGETLVLPILYGCVTYRSEFSENIRRTAFAFKLRQKSDTIYTQGIQRGRETPKGDIQMLGGIVFAD